MPPETFTQAAQRFPGQVILGKVKRYQEIEPAMAEMGYRAISEAVFREHDGSDIRAVLEVADDPIDAGLLNGSNRKPEYVELDVKPILLQKSDNLTS